jgi:hypothetical protein
VNRFDFKPIAKDLDFKRADIVRGLFVIEFREQEYTLITDGDKLMIFDAIKNHVGTVRLVTSNTGCLFLSDNVVGEYRLNESGNCRVWPIEDGFKVPEKPLEADPIEHLLGVYHAR